jgi:hypothetical protein
MTTWQLPNPFRNSDLRQESKGGVERRADGNASIFGFPRKSSRESLIVVASNPNNDTQRKLWFSMRSSVTA